MQSTFYVRICAKAAQTHIPIRVHMHKEKGRIFLSPYLSLTVSCPPEMVFLNPNLEKISSKSRANHEQSSNFVLLFANLSKSRGLPGLKNPSLRSRKKESCVQPAGEPERETFTQIFRLYIPVPIAFRLDSH